MLAIFYTLIPIFGIMAIGFFADRGQLLPSEAAKSLNQFVYWFSLPLLLFSIMSHISPEEMSAALFIGGTIGFLASQVIVMMILRVLGWNWQKSIMGGMLGGFPNVAFMGIPIILILYPESSEAKIVAGIAAILPTANLVLTDIALTLLGKNDKNIAKVIKNIFHGIYTNPGLLGATFGALVGLAGLPLPSALLQIAEMMGNTASPCALFCIGMYISVQFTTWKQNKSLKEKIQTNFKQTWIAYVIIIIGKLFLTPIVMYYCCLVLGVQGISLSTITITSSMSTAIVCHVISLKHEMITTESTNLILMCAILSMLSLPIVIAITQALVQQ